MALDGAFAEVAVAAEDLDGFVGDAGGHFAGEKIGDGGVHGEAGAAIEMTEREERSLHYASAKGTDAPVGMTHYERSQRCGRGGREWMQDRPV